MKTFQLLALCLSILAVTSSCKKDRHKNNNTLLNPGPKFSMNKFEQNLIDNINFGSNSPTGWAYAISQMGTLERSDAFGDARLAQDNQMDFSLNKEINVASVTKFYTSIAAMQLLDANNLTIDSLIEPWLPSSWNRGPGVFSLTFKDLLKHESGLNSINSNFDSTLGYAGLQGCIAIGVTNPKTRNYLNVNFALFRVLIPSLWSALQGSPAINIENDVNTQLRYLLYMQEKIFDPLGLPQVGCTPEDRQASTLYYNVNDPGTTNLGVWYGGWNNKAGGGGHFMTTLEMAKVNAFFEHTNVLLTKELRDIIKEHRMGLDLAIGSMEEHGKYYSKNGSIGTGGANSRGVLTQVIMFPFNGVDCTVVMNCQGNTVNDPSGNNSLLRTIMKAYNDAWE